MSDNQCTGEAAQPCFGNHCASGGLDCSDGPPPVPTPGTYSCPTGTTPHTDSGAMPNNYLSWTCLDGTNGWTPVDIYSEGGETAPGGTSCTAAPR